MNYDKLVSIITPSFNSKDFIEKTIKSVLAQSYKNWELIIVDDKSKDNSNEIIEKYLKLDNRIKLIKLEKNSGVAIARNRAIKEAKGRFIAFLDSDDIWEKNKLEKQISFMIKNNYAFTYTAYERIDENCKTLNIINITNKVNYKSLLKSNIIACLTVIYDKDKIGKFYMSSNTKREDFATWLQILKTTGFAYGLNEQLAKYRVYSRQSSNNKFKMAIENWKLYRNIERLNIFKSSYYFINYAFLGLLKTKFPKIAKFFGLL